jgi:hypothetical protein
MVQEGIDRERPGLLHTGIGEQAMAIQILVVALGVRTAIVALSTHFLDCL